MIGSLAPAEKQQRTTAGGGNNDQANATQAENQKGKNGLGEGKDTKLFPNSSDTVSATSTKEEEVVWERDPRGAGPAGGWAALRFNNNKRSERRWRLFSQSRSQGVLVGMGQGGEGSRTLG